VDTAGVTCSCAASDAVRQYWILECLSWLCCHA